MVPSRFNFLLDVNSICRLNLEGLDHWFSIPSCGLSQDIVNDLMTGRLGREPPQLCRRWAHQLHAGGHRAAALLGPAGARDAGTSSSLVNKHEWLMQ